MIKKHFLIPQFYIHKIAICDECNVELVDTGSQFAYCPPILIYKCPKCQKKYEFKENELKGEWKWRTI